MSENLKSLLTIEQQLEDCIQSFLIYQINDLAEVTVGHPELSFLKISKDTDSVPPNVNLFITSLSADMDGLGYVENLGKEFLKFTAGLEIEVTSDPSMEHTRDQHQELVGIVRSCFLNNIGKFTETNLPNISLHQIRLANVQRSVQEGTVTTHLFEIRLSLRPDAFPDPPNSIG